MTKRQEELVNYLRRVLFLYDYPPVFIVDLETLEAVEEAILVDLESKNKPPIIQCGKNGVFFKGCELVLEVKSSA